MISFISKKLPYIIITFFLLAQIGCVKKEPIIIDGLSRPLIPIPEQLKYTDSAFSITKNTQVFLSESLSTDHPMIMDFKKRWEEYTKEPLTIKKSKHSKKSNAVFLSINTIKNDNAPEAYALRVNREQISLNASTEEGLYRGMQTLWQLFPDDPNSLLSGESTPLGLPGCVITDAPKYPYRGAMLDVSRHFFSTEQVKLYIQQLAQYKINYLHLHLSDDQGWRIEIKSWPKLTEVGGSTAVGGGTGGFFSQEDYKEIVAFAKAHFITIIPEIDMPGHTNAALASYTELNCNDKATALYTGMEVGFSSLCIDKEITYTFIDDVIRELAAMTPGPYIHIGGDESHATSKADYKLFIDKIQPIIKKHGKQVVGWEDISATDDLVEGTLIQHWNNATTAKAGADKGASVILSPASRVYLDMKYEENTQLGLKWAGYINLKTAYDWQPHDILEIPEHRILGIESPLWSETITSSAELEYMVFPRILAHAELGWSNSELLDWEHFLERLKLHTTRMEIQGVNYYKSPLLVKRK